MNFFRYLCLCFVVMMFFGAFRGNCMEPKQEDNSFRCFICGGEVKMIFTNKSVTRNFCELRCFKTFLRSIMQEERRDDDRYCLDIECDNIPECPTKSSVLEVIRFNYKVIGGKDNALKEDGTTRFRFEWVDGCTTPYGVLKGI